MSIKTPSLLETSHPFRQWKTMQLPGTQLTLTGYSRSNDKTFFHIPELRCALDAGLCEGRQPETVFLSHTHNDHTSDLEFLASRSGGVTLYAPAQATPYIETYIRARREMNHVADFDPSLSNPLSLKGVQGGDTLSMGKRDQYAIDIVDCVHKVPCVGYCFSERKKRLKPVYQEKKQEYDASGDKAAFGKWMGELRKQGIDVQEMIKEPLFAFLGDTHVDVFHQHPWLFSYPTIITECTYLHDTEETRANEKGHTVWCQLAPIIEAHPDTTFVLTHFSLRHSDREVLAFFQEQARLRPNLRPERLVIWANEQSLLPEQHQSRS